MLMVVVEQRLGGEGVGRGKKIKTAERQNGQKNKEKWRVEEKSD